MLRSLIAIAAAACGSSGTLWETCFCVRLWPSAVLALLSGRLPDAGAALATSFAVPVSSSNSVESA